MTVYEFAEKAQKLYDNYKGSAGELGHFEMDELMRECLISLGYEEGVKILDSMTNIWYS